MKALTPTMPDRPPGARETVQAYLRGDISLEEAAERATRWYAWKFPNRVGE